MTPEQESSWQNYLTWLSWQKMANPDDADLMRRADMFLAIDSELKEGRTALELKNVVTSVLPHMDHVYYEVNPGQVAHWAECPKCALNKAVKEINDAKS